MTEIALVLPILLTLMLSIVDFGHMAAMHAAAVTASREAARYGSAVGPISGGTTPRYLDCAGIKAAASRVLGSLITLQTGDIAVTYLTGSNVQKLKSDGVTPVDCQTPGGAPVASDIARYDRVMVTVNFSYSPITPALQSLMGPRTVVSTDRRTIFKQ